MAILGFRMFPMKMLGSMIFLGISLKDLKIFWRYNSDNLTLTLW